ncbi:MAG: cytidylate kinase family protein [Chloroflexi bacterium]|nr:cytidylate kinase family protein [Chloroflexota bacterium]
MSVVTISRMLASDGDEVAAALASRLGYRLVGREDLVSLASALGEPDAIGRSPELRERSPSFWERLNEERSRYASVLRNVVLRLAAEDDVVIVGLGAGQLLRELKHVLRVQIIAPPAQRLERLMKSGSDERPGPLTREQARELIRGRDREAAGYIRYLFNVDWMEAHNWDLVLNTGRFDVSAAADAIAAVLQTGVARMQPADRRRLADLTLAGTVESALLNHPGVWVNGLRVRASEGRITLEGEVIAEDDREVVEQVVRTIEGVRAVENDLRIQPPPLTGM